MPQAASCRSALPSHACSGPQTHSRFFTRRTTEVLKGDSMTKQLSFTKYENEIMGDFRERLNKAESTEDVKKFFTYSIKSLMENIFADALDFRLDDIVLLTDEPYYRLNKRLLEIAEFQAAWSDSDLPRMVTRLAGSALKRFRHLEKNPGKTESKIRM
jgi:hypothetical protein